MSLPSGSGASKFDEQSALRLQPYESMFQTVADVLSWKDMHDPVAGHPEKFSVWRDETDNAVGEFIENTMVFVMTPEIPVPITPKFKCSTNNQLENT
jgi:hypothetical protein